jgi:membrane protease YdiL (CAAX protease family)
LVLSDQIATGRSDVWKKIGKSMKPMKLDLSMLYFGIPALIFVFGFWVLMPWFIDLGIFPYYAYMLGLGIPLIIMFAASLYWLKLEGYPINWNSIQERFRVKKMDRQTWIWSIGALLFGSVLGYGLVSLVSDWLIATGIMPLPNSLPAFMSPQTLTDPVTVYNEATGGLRGNWLPFIGMAILLFFNIAGEELWWRGVVLPRQELAFGKWTWVIHGVMWAFFHIFKWWDVLNLLPITLSIAFVASRFKNTSAGIFMHGVTNGIALIPLLLGVLGIMK